MLLPYCPALALQANALITRHVIFSRAFQVVAKTEPKGLKQYTDLTRLMLRRISGTNVFPMTFPTRWCNAFASGDTCFVSEKIGWLGITWFDLSTQCSAAAAPTLPECRSRCHPANAVVQMRGAAAAPALRPKITGCRRAAPARL